jgi:flavorubredoxin
METVIDEIAPDIYRMSTYVPDAGMTFNQILVNAEEPLLFHCGMRALFPNTSQALGRVIPIERLRWISFGHVEADECGALNQWLAAAPRAEVAFGALGCAVSVNDLADRPPRPLADGEVLELGGKSLRYLATPHVPHGWDAGIFFEETTSTLLCGDLFTATGEAAPLSWDSPLAAAGSAEDLFGYSCLAPSTPEVIGRLAALEPSTLALMHGSAHTGDGSAWLRELAAAYEHRMANSSPAVCG